MNWFRVLKNAGVPILAAIALVGWLLFGVGQTSQPSAPVAPGEVASPADASATASDEPVWTGGEENAEHHWQKHGGEFPQFTTRDGYVAGAHAFVDHPPPGTLTKQRDNGDTLFYDPDSNTFAVRASNGAPRTFFKPDNGRAYWDRQ